MPVSPKEAWPWLVRASKWPEWYPDIKRVRIQDGQSELRLGSRFHWKFSIVSLDSIVEEFVPFERLAWTVRSIGIDAYHAWLIERLPLGCLISSEETQNGWVGGSLERGNKAGQHKEDSP